MATALPSARTCANSIWSFSCRSPPRNTEAGSKRCPRPSKANTASWTKRPPRTHATFLRLRFLYRQRHGSIVGGKPLREQDNTPVYPGKRFSLRADLRNHRANWRSFGWWSTGPRERKSLTNCYLAHFHREPSKALCLKRSRSRWHGEQYFQRSKDDRGLDHYEGRSWRGFHHHLVMSAIAYLFILTTYLAAKKNFWSDVGEDPGSDPAVATEIDRTLSLLPLDIPGEDR